MPILLMLLFCKIIVSCADIPVAIYGKAEKTILTVLESNRKEKNDCENTEMEFVDA